MTAPTAFDLDTEDLAAQAEADRIIHGPPTADEMPPTVSEEVLRERLTQLTARASSDFQRRRVSPD